jgi:hypothetical protein
MVVEEMRELEPLLYTTGEFAGSFSGGSLYFCHEFVSEENKNILVK